MTQNTQTNYHCAGRNCNKRDTCHRHTSSMSISNADFNDYDLSMIRELPSPCQYFIERNQAEGLVAK